VDAQSTERTRIAEQTLRREATAAQKEANMADLKCAVENCCYNEQHLCCKGDICVGGEKACLLYALAFSGLSCTSSFRISLVRISSQI